jgi:hypothetical protein
VRTKAGRRDGAEHESVGTEIITARAFVLLQETFPDQSGEQSANRSFAQSGVRDQIGQSCPTIAVRRDFPQQSNSSLEALRPRPGFGDICTMHVNSPVR